MSSSARLIVALGAALALFGCNSEPLGQSALDGTFPDLRASDGDLATIAFTHCPYRELAEAHPEVICHLHRGLVEGFVEEHGGAGVEQFGTLVDREPCQVVLSVE